MTRIRDALNEDGKVDRIPNADKRLATSKQQIVQPSQVTRLLAAALEKGEHGMRRLVRRAIPHHNDGQKLNSVGRGALGANDCGKGIALTKIGSLPRDIIQAYGHRLLA